VTLTRAVSKRELQKNPLINNVIGAFRRVQEALGLIQPQPKIEHDTIEQHIEQHTEQEQPEHAEHAEHAEAQIDLNTSAAHSPHAHVHVEAHTAESHTAEAEAHCGAISVTLS
jgi:hypothetical protein